MARISIEEGQRIAERSAWAAHGEKNAWWYLWGRRVAPFAALAVATGALLGGAYWAVTKVDITMPDAPRTTGTPALAWIGLAALAGLTLLAFATRPTRFITAAGLWVVVVLGWLFAVVYALGFML